MTLQEILKLPELIELRKQIQEQVPHSANESRLKDVWYEQAFTGGVHYAEGERLLSLEERYTRRVNELCAENGLPPYIVKT